MSSPFPRMLQDNVLLWLYPTQRQTRGGIVIPDSVRLRKRHRVGLVCAAGPGFHVPRRDVDGVYSSTFIATTLKVGDNVVIAWNGGNNFAWDVSAIRHHERAQDFAIIGDMEGEFRIIREQEAHAIVEGDGKDLMDFLGVETVERPGWSKRA